MTKDDQEWLGDTFAYSDREDGFDSLRAKIRLQSSVLANTYQVVLPECEACADALEAIGFAFERAMDALDVLNAQQLRGND